MEKKRDKKLKNKLKEENKDTQQAGESKQNETRYFILFMLFSNILDIKYNDFL